MSRLKILIANRGEIAVRIARTARKLGFESVAVYSDADRHALHVGECDQAVRIGPAEAAQSYLHIDALIEAARRTGARAVHPGYGFLSENAGFAQAVVDAGLIWIGPRAEAIACMGSKIEARRLAADAGVPVLPGYSESQESADLARAAEEIGYPVLIKASAGGGGKGIRAVHDSSEFASQLELAREESRRSFGDDAVIVERLVTQPRHIEVQVFGDRHGHTIHLGTRECSIQRRHQKVIEEAPAPALDETTRAGLHEAAVALTSAIAYDNAGTIEFIVDAETGAYFFLEMNTRLQVEHPTTEMVTGLDLVELQIRIALGEPLPLTAADVTWQGHAIEARLAAEDPWRGFLPQTGSIAELRAPQSIRWDAGIAWGSEVSPHYDSMIAKLIAHGADRDEARRRLVAGIDELHMAGVRTNQAFLRWILTHPEVVAGPVTTRFLDDAVLPDPPPADAAAPHAALALWLRASQPHSSPSPWNRLRQFRVTPHRGAQVYALETEDAQQLEVAIVADRDRYRIDGLGTVRASLRHATLEVEAEDGVLERLPVTFDSHRVTVTLNGSTTTFRVVSREERWLGNAEHDGSLADALQAPFPGVATSVEVEPGAVVKQGQVLVVLEAMKMLHSLPASGDGTVAEVRVTPGMAVEQGSVLITFVAAPTED